MGTLLDFTSAQRPLTRVGKRQTEKSLAKDGSSGEVILFPGVRYEHHELDLAARIATIRSMGGSKGSEQD